jgi:cytochrome c5
MKTTDLLKMMPVLGLSLGMIGCSTSEPHPGQAIWEGSCLICHSTGLAGAPMIGDEKAWGKRITRGKESLYGHAINGWGDMPARGGNPELDDNQVKLAVDYMLSKFQ